MDEWKAQVVFMPGSMLNALYVHRKTGYGTREFLTNGNIIKSFKTDEPKPKDDELYLALLDDDQMKAIAVALELHGVKLPEASFTEGKLEATERHLEDMRSIVGHVKKITLKEAK